METTIEVADEKEATLLKAGLEDPAVRAFVKISAALAPLNNDEDRLRVTKAVAIVLGIPSPPKRT